MNAFEVVVPQVERSRPLVSSQRNTFFEIHNRAMAAAANYKRSEIELLEILLQVEESQIYFQMEITSLFRYCVEMLDLSRHSAYNFITVMRKSQEVPAMIDAIRKGEVSVSKARKVCPVITTKNSKEWLGLARECSSRIVEKAVAMANPRAAVVESLKYVAGDTLELRMAVSENWSDLLSNVKDLMSQKSRRAVSTEEALFQLMEEYKRKHDPVLKAERSELRQKARAGAPASSWNSVDSSRDALKRYIPAKTRHGVALRDNGKCSFVDRHGKRCGSGRWIQRHHVMHFADGGTHAPENLETLCWAHHVMKHRH